jgi:hypothetical protein
MRHVAARVVASQNRVAGAGPTIAALIVGRGKPGPKVGPPRRRRRIGGDRIELDEMAGWTFTRTGHAERHRGTTVYVGQDEAAFVEMEPRERRGGAPIIGVEIGAVSENGIALSLVEPAAARLDPTRGHRTKQLRHAGWFPGAQIQHAAARRVPRLTSGQVDVDPILERHIRPENVQHVDLGGGRGGGVSRAVIVRAERIFVRMSSCVRAGDASDGRVRENYCAVARDQITPVEALAEEERVFV